MGHAYLKASEGTCRLVAACAPRNGQDDSMTQHFLEVSQRVAAPAPQAAPAQAARAAKPAVPTNATKATKATRATKARTPRR
jgi:hypothetical protein